MTSAAVIIPTTGRPSLRKAFDSIVNQSYTNVDPIVVYDGPGAFPLFGNEYPTFRLPFNTGSGGYCGHRIYGAIPYLLPHDYIFFLDDDNEYHETHVSDCIRLCESMELDWCYSFREIYEGDQFVCRDECESLGKWPIWYNTNCGHVDTSCFCMKRSIAIGISPLWNQMAHSETNRVTNPDTVIANHLMKHSTSFGCTMKFTVKYRLGSRSASPRAEFFIKGNSVYRNAYPGGLPWEVPEAESTPGDKITRP